MRSWIISMMLFNSIMAYSCDVCGGLSSNPNIGLFSASTSFHQFGIRSNYRYFKTYLFGLEHSKEQLVGGEFFGRLQLAQRFQLLATVPYQYAIQNRGIGQDIVRGIGDPGVLGNWIAIEKVDSNQVTKHFLSCGVGVSFPLGRNTIPENELKNLYPGSGAFNLLVASNYLHQFSSKFGIQSEASYSIKGIDRFGFRYGNSLLIQTQVVYRKNYRAKLFIATLGCQYEHQGPSDLNGESFVDNPNDAEVLSTKVSLNLMKSAWMWSIQFQRPVYQEINNGSVRQNFNTSVGLSYFLTKNKKNEKV
jgi:hypothetical protein